MGLSASLVILLSKPGPRKLSPKIVHSRILVNQQQLHRDVGGDLVGVGHTSTAAATTAVAKAPCSGTGVFAASRKPASVGGTHGGATSVAAAHCILAGVPQAPGALARVGVCQVVAPLPGLVQKAQALVGADLFAVDGEAGVDAGVHGHIKDEAWWWKGGACDDDSWWFLSSMIRNRGEERDRGPASVQNKQTYHQRRAGCRLCLQRRM